MPGPITTFWTSQHDRCRINRSKLLCSVDKVDPRLYSLYAVYTLGPGTFEFELNTKTSLLAPYQLSYTIPVMFVGTF